MSSGEERIADNRDTTVMGLVTYVLLSTLIAGLNNVFKPELLGMTATTSIIIVVMEIMALKLGCYLLSISSQSQLYDLIAYSGYKFVGIIVTMVVSQTFSAGEGTVGWIGWATFLYTFLANSLFLVRCSLFFVHTSCKGQRFLPKSISGILTQTADSCAL